MAVDQHGHEGMPDRRRRTQRTGIELLRLRFVATIRRGEDALRTADQAGLNRSGLDDRERKDLAAEQSVAGLHAQGIWPRSWSEAALDSDLGVGPAAGACVMLH